MTIDEFVVDLWLSCPVTPELMTVEDATIDIENFIADGWELPDGLNAELLSEKWNILVVDAERNDNYET